MFDIGSYIGDDGQKFMPFLNLEGELVLLPLDDNNRLYSELIMESWAAFGDNIPFDFSDGRDNGNYDISNDGRLSIRTSFGSGFKGFCIKNKFMQQSKTYHIEIDVEQLSTSGLSQGLIFGIKNETKTKTYISKINSPKLYKNTIRFNEDDMDELFIGSASNSNHSFEIVINSIKITEQ